MSRNHVFAITALLIVIFLAVFAWPHPAAELEPLSVGGQTLPIDHIAVQGVRRSSRACPR